MGTDYENEENWNEAADGTFCTDDGRFTARPSANDRWLLTDAQTRYRLDLPTLDACRRTAVHMAELYAHHVKDQSAQ